MSLLNEILNNSSPSRKRQLGSIAADLTLGAQKIPGLLERIAVALEAKTSTPEVDTSAQINLTFDQDSLNKAAQDIEEHALAKATDNAKGLFARLNDMQSRTVMAWDIASMSEGDIAKLDKHLHWVQVYLDMAETDGAFSPQDPPDTAYPASCPQCGRDGIPSYRMGISKVDNTTAICGDCASAQALGI